MNQNGIALPNGSKLKEFTIVKELGTGAFGVTYLAVDKDSNQFAIKEYLPNDLAIRQVDQTISPKSESDKDNFYYGLDSFIDEAQTLEKFNHPNIVKTNGFFKENGTVYIVMDYEEGQDLHELLGKEKKLDEDKILSIILPLLDGLRAVHAQSFLHRDIKPGNIYIRTNGIPMLIDFGASRIALGEKSKSLSVVLTDGYAPKEQYSSRSKQGTYTDIYAIGAVMYKMMTGETPIESSARSDAVTDDEPDPHPKLLAQDSLSRYSHNLKKATDWSLELKGKNRPQSVRELQDLLLPKVMKEKEVSKEVYSIDNTKYKIGNRYFISGKYFILTEKGFKKPTSANCTYSYELGIKLIEKQKKEVKNENNKQKEIEIQEYATKSKSFVAPFFFNLSMAVLGGIVSFITLYVLLFSIEINVIAANIISFFAAPVVIGVTLGIINKELNDWSYTLVALSFFLSAAFLN